MKIHYNKESMLMEITQDSLDKLPDISLAIMKKHCEEKKINFDFTVENSREIFNFDMISRKILDNLNYRVEKLLRDRNLEVQNSEIVNQRKHHKNLTIFGALFSSAAGATTTIVKTGWQFGKIIMNASTMGFFGGAIGASLSIFTSVLHNNLLREVNYQEAMDYVASMEANFALKEILLTQFEIYMTRIQILRENKLIRIVRKKDGIKLDENHLTCPISMDIMQDPITAPDGRLYERKFLVEFYNRGNRVCPMNPGVPLTDPRLLPTNFVVKSMCLKYQEHLDKADTVEKALKIEVEASNFRNNVQPNNNLAINR